MLVETMIKTVGEINGRKIKYQPGTDILRVSNYPPHYRYHNLPVFSQGNIWTHYFKCGLISGRWNSRFRAFTHINFSRCNFAAPYFDIYFERTHPQAVINELSPAIYIRDGRTKFLHCIDWAHLVIKRLAILRSAGL